MHVAVYLPLLVPLLAAVAARRMAQMLDAEPDRAAVLARFVSGLAGSDEELLRRMLGEGIAGGG